MTHFDTRGWVGAVDGVVGAKLAWVGALDPDPEMMAKIEDQ